MKTINEQLKILDVNNMKEFYEKYCIFTNNGFSFIFNEIENVNIVYYKYRFLDMFAIFPNGRENVKIRSEYYTEGEYYKVLKTLFDMKEYDKFEYFAKLLEFTNCEEYIDELFEPYLILNRLEDL